DARPSLARRAHLRQSPKLRGISQRRSTSQGVSRDSSILLKRFAARESPFQPQSVGTSSKRDTLSAANVAKSPFGARGPFASGAFLRPTVVFASLASISPLRPVGQLST